MGWHLEISIIITNGLAFRNKLNNNQRFNQKWTIQGNWQQQGTQDKDKKNKDTTQYDITMRKQTQIT